MIKRMRQVFAPALALAILLAAGHADAQQNAQTDKMADKTAPSYDMKAQALQDLDGMHKQFVSLLEAMPQDKLTWRPADGVRSVSELVSSREHGELFDTEHDGRSGAGGNRLEDV